VRFRERVGESNAIDHRRRRAATPNCDAREAYFNRE
jgi:hypothetical protein